MKVSRKFFFGLVLFFAISLQCETGCKKSGEYTNSLNALKRYPYERAHIVYEYTGDVRGIEEFFFSDYGKYEARYSKIDVLSDKGIRSSYNGSVIRLVDQYNIDFTKKAVTHDRPSTLDSLYHLEGNGIPTPEQYFESEMKRNFFHAAGSDIIAGKSAVRWIQDNQTLTVWMWNGILLRKHVSSETGSMDMTLKSIDSLWTVDTTKFSVPTGFTLTESRK